MEDLNEEEKRLDEYLAKNSPELLLELNKRRTNSNNKPEMKIQDILVNLFIRLLYLTPIGLYLNLIYLATGKGIPGIIIKDGLVLVKENPTINDRINWFISGIFILSEGWYFLKIGGVLYQVIIMFGFPAVIAFVSCFYPRFYWNKKISLLSGIIILIIFSISSFLLAYFIASLL